MQMNRNSNWISKATIIMIMGLFIVSCKKKYDEPPVIGPPGIVANITIKDLKARFTSTGTTVAITDDAIIEGVVSCDDRSGNFYQQIAIQDATGGILLRLAGNNLFNNYPVGRQVFVKCKGLFIGEYGRMIQLGGGVETGGFVGVTLLAVNLQDQHLIKGALNQPLVPKVVTVAQLGTTLQDPYVNTVVKLENFEFATAELSKNYADDDQSGNRIIQACTAPTTNRLTLRTSDFANFATIKVPQGNGDIIGVYSIFNSTKQFTIRDTTDVRFYGPRCSAGSGGSGSGSITLGATSPFIIDFNGIASSLPTGVYLKQEASTTALGNDGQTYMGTLSAKAAWNVTSLGFRNYASATGLVAGSAIPDQDNSVNRALGVRQTSTVGAGGDPGAAFAFQIANTTGKSNLKLEFLLQSLDASSGRTTTWSVDYGLGDTPSSFTNVAATGTMTTGNLAFSSRTITVNFPAALNNQAGKIWIRIVALGAAPGAGNRASSAIDDVKFSWN
jgi:hypothetical protein